MTLSPLLKLVLRVDAASGAAMAPALLLGAGFLAPMLGLPEDLLRGAGLVLALVALFIAAQLMRPHASVRAIWAIVAINIFWSVDSFLLLAAGLIQPTGLGYAFVIGQALFVGALALIQIEGLKRLPAQT